MKIGDGCCWAGSGRTREAGHAKASRLHSERRGAGAERTLAGRRSIRRASIPASTNANPCLIDTRRLLVKVSIFEHTHSRLGRVECCMIELCIAPSALPDRSRPSSLHLPSRTPTLIAPARPAAHHLATTPRQEMPAHTATIGHPRSPALDGDRLEDIEPTQRRADDAPRHLGVPMDLLYLLLSLVDKQQLGRDVLHRSRGVVLLLILVLLDAQVPQGDLVVRAAGGKARVLGRVPLDRGDRGRVP